MPRPGFDDEPLKPVYEPCRPPWIGYWNKRWDQRDKSKTRKSWWTELGWTNAAAEEGKMYGAGPQIRELDPEYYDPKVPDGTSLAGPMGLDSKRYPNLTLKADQIGDYGEFKNKVYKNSTQYKDIAAKYELTEGQWPHFKGLQVMSANEKLHEFQMYNTPSWMPKKFRFSNTPLNEDPLVKGLACAQYMAIVMFPYTGLYIRGFNIPPFPTTIGTIAKTYFRLLPLPTTLSFTWGVALSGSAMVRHRDDFTNHFFASAATGVVFGTIKHNTLSGFSLGIMVCIAGLMWQYLRVSEAGLQSKVFHRKCGNFYGGPLTWKLFWRGEGEKVPEKRW